MATTTDITDKEKTRKEKLGAYFYDLSKLTYGALVLGAMMPVISHTFGWLNVLMIVFGLVTSYAFAYVANKIYKNKQ